MGLTDTTRSVRQPSGRRHPVFTDTRAAEEVDGATPTPELHELMSPEVNVQRIMSTGTLWFMATVASVAIALGFLLSSGWRPSVLPTGLEALWWVAFVAVTLAIGLIGWSGCPILEVSVPVADRNKTRTMQLGTGMFIVGSAVALFAVLMGPAA